MRTLARASLLLLLGCGASPADGARLRIVGSDTELTLVERIVERYCAERDVSISVSGGGSGAGLAALIEHRADVANSSRPARPEERASAAVSLGGLREIVVAIDALAVIVNEDLGIDRLSLDDVARIYRGDVSRWSALGGPDAEITRYGRQSNSGTYEYFREAVLHADYSLEMLSMSGNSQIVEAVRQDRFGIGYVGSGYVMRTRDAAQGVTVVAIEIGDRGVSPLDADAVARGEYPIARPLFQYTGRELAPELHELLAFELGDEGQRVVVEAGFHPLDPERLARSREVIGP